jgi:hypothetical protein
MEMNAIGALESSPPDRVRTHSPEEVNRQVDQQSKECVKAFASKSKEEISRHIDELSREWDMERLLETNASILALTGVVLGATVSRKFLVVPGIVMGFFLQHALQGWCPPVPVFRRFGVRTRKEINREKYALKALRGDFDAASAPPNGGEQQAEEVFEANKP